MFSDEQCDYHPCQKALDTLILFIGHWFFGILVTICDGAFTTHDAQASRFMACSYSFTG